MLVIVMYHSSRAQTFTKITTGDLVNDGGASRSVNWVDYDNDGNLDLFVSNGLEGGEVNFLYKNGGPPSYSFTRITTGDIATDAFPSDGTSWGDVDNDGDLDCFVVNWYNLNNNFYLNNGDGTFTKVTTGAPVTDGGYSESCSWGDYDNDGYIDLYVANSGFNAASGATKNFFYKNNGNGTFTKITTGEIANDIFFSRCVNWVDYDNDGDLDAYVANERNQNNNLYRNMLKESGTASFTKVTGQNIVTDGSSSWSSSWGDYDNDGDLDLFLGISWPFPGNNHLYKNNGDRTFTRVLTDTLVKHFGYHASSGWGDFDNDGDLDMYVTTAYSGGSTKNLLYKNMLVENGTASFEFISSGDIVNDTGDSYGFNWGDYDNDGDLDVFVGKTENENENNALYRNDNANGNHWLKLNFVGTTSNRSGIGVKARIKTGTMWQMREVSGQSGLCSQNLILHFGVGGEQQIDSMIVEWPSGTVNSYGAFPADQHLTVQELSSADVIVSPGWNLISIPLSGSGSINSLFSGATSPAYQYSDSSGYSADTLFESGEGFWLKFSSPDTVSIPGVQTFSHDIPVTAGWNMIGPLDYPVDTTTITTTPPGILLSPFYGFDGGYHAPASLVSGQGYWVKASQAGMLQLLENPALRRRASPGNVQK